LAVNATQNIFAAGRALYCVHVQNAREGRGLDSEQAVTYEVAPKRTSLEQIFAHPPQASTEPETPATPHVRSGSGRLRSLESCHTFNPGRGHNLPTRLGQAFASWTVAQWNTVHGGCPVVIVLGRFDCVW
jgi:hypothetical protein